MPKQQLIAKDKNHAPHQPKTFSRGGIQGFPTPWKPLKNFRIPKEHLKHRHDLATHNPCHGLTAALTGLKTVKPQVMEDILTSASCPHTSLQPTVLATQMCSSGPGHRAHQKHTCHPRQGSTPPRARTAGGEHCHRGFASPKCWPARHARYTPCQAGNMDFRLPF